MPDGKASTRAKNKYNAANYDSLRIIVPKGQKATVQRAAEAEGESINSFTNKALLASMGLTEWPVVVTEKEEIINPQTLKPYEDDGSLNALDGLHREVMTIQAGSPQEAMRIAAKEYKRHLRKTASITYKVDGCKTEEDE